MNREIKFRLLDASKHVVGYVKWYVGELQEEGYVAEPRWLYSNNGERWNPTEIPHRFKLQYTGLKDKNGKEIYEGDIVKVRDWIGSIIWHESGWFLDNKKWFEGLMGIVNFKQDIEVIGNIYENPELIN